MASQLLSLSLFPCAPQFPSLAVDLALLRFVRELFVRLPPNTSSFCETLEAFLSSRGYKLQTRVSCYYLSTSYYTHTPIQDTLRRRFGQALQWYSALSNATDKAVQDHLEQGRDTLLRAVETGEGEVDSPPIPSLRPSEYLRSRCPLCFGGTQSTPDAK